MHKARPGRGLRPFQVALLVLDSRLAPTTSIVTLEEVQASYTPPISRDVRVSPPWVPVVMFVLLGLGALVILFYYLGFVPGGRSNWYLFSGLTCVLGGLFTATKYH